jgi:hypothetical protein
MPRDYDPELVDTHRCKQREGTHLAVGDLARLWSGTIANDGY